MMDIRSIVDKISESESNYDNIFLDKRKNYSFINPYGYHLLRKNFQLYQNLDGLFVDGILMCLLLKFLWKIKVVRRSFDMTTVARELFIRLNKSNLTIYFVGAKKIEISSTVQHIQKRFPKMKIIGYRDGYFLSEYEYKNSQMEIINLNPDFVVVGMGAILQEKFIVDLKELGYTGISFTCGGYLRQACDGVDYFPKWIDAFHLRAFYRLYKEPETWKRLFNVLIQFPILFIYDSLFLTSKQSEE